MTTVWHAPDPFAPWHIHQRGTCKICGFNPDAAPTLKGKLNMSEPNQKRDDALLTALALLEQHDAARENPLLAQTLLGGLDAESCVRLIASLASLAHHLAGEVAELTGAPVEDILAQLRHIHTEHLGAA
ncbi:hypothetical protein MYCODSM44623_04372 [Mycobacterium intracellulare subsp. chimaera]|uniref:hypothetical protein n=1 Tax=Mycobacterium intracellulare TaxID=1767 RepID=UPI00093B09F7|nr:hypothetical protein [Mycobacterium intracellulare]ASL11064.1 hypothetical protein MYCODSM44623_04372 [Mycobacterium intracellulare subsp. chimaera]MCV7324547.1 hypothetical protein [Mycobacterium intracellulare subsp. chimaera]ORV33109.1 hypothetical protein AWB97_10100 [Mycobacterium intracellulare subsp. chimaera]